MDTIKISLAIFGNQNSNSGFQPLYWINDPPQQLENIVPPGMDENPYFFTLQVLPAHTQYTLIHNRVSSYMSARPGVLKMAIAIPKGYSISNGVSPLEVLLSVRQQFVDTCMTLRDSHVQAYNFKEKLAPSDDFISIVNAYQLVPSTQPHLPMNGTENAVMLLDDTAISQLFVTPQHPEFQQFKCIVIANKGNTSIYKAQLNNIPLTVVSETANDDTDNPTVSSIPTQTATAKNDSAQQKKYLLILLGILIVMGGAFFLLRPASDHQEEEETDDVELSDRKAYWEEEEEELPATELPATHEKKETPAPVVEKKAIEDSKQPMPHPHTQRHVDGQAEEDDFNNEYVNKY